MSIKADADDIYFASRSHERQLAQALDEGFDVTHGRVEGELAYWLAEPKSGFRERFGFDQELLVIYSRHHITDARVLTTLESLVHSSGLKHRVDKVVALLIHEGDDNAVRALLGKQTDRVVVPMLAAELLDKTRGPLFLRSRIAEWVGDVDLFSFSSPINADQYFFGRDEIVNEIVTQVSRRHQNLGLFGLRRTGKTSVLFAVERRLDAEDSKILGVYVDAQNPGMHSARWWVALQNIAERVKEELFRKKRRTAVLSGDYKEDTAGTRFARDIGTIISTGQIDGIVLMVDEIEYITAGVSGRLGLHWDSDFFPFWQTMRAVHQESKGAFSFIVSGVNPRVTEAESFGGQRNPIFEFVTTKFLPSLTHERTRELVRTTGRYSGLKFDEAVYPYLHTTYGGHPYLTRLACSVVWSRIDRRNPQAPAAVAVSSFAACEDQIRQRIFNPMRDILLSLVWWYPEEYEILRVLADGDLSFYREYCESNPTLKRNFEAYGLVDGNGQFGIGALQSFLQRHGSKFKEQISPFTRGDVPPAMLPNVPDLDTLSKLFERRVDTEVGLRRAVMVFLGVASGFDPGKLAKKMLEGLRKTSERPRPEDLFVGRTPKEVIEDLYLLDLGTIITTHWETFKNLFDNDRGRFQMNLDAINVARRIEAHTKNFKDTEIDAFTNSYEWVRQRLAKVPS